ncbi:MAG TPA: hypothetical protein PLY32_03405 [Salinivirgaceae bacterium]|nr:hypothetical protein [Salinivirgaceae bacterium]HQA76146.1 hypothetical protein [Salinivirgaceae bacterium]
MKNLFLSITTISLIFASCKKNNESTPLQYGCDFINFKYYNGTQDYLGEMQDNYVLLGIDTIYSDSQIRSFIATVKEFDQNYDYTIHVEGRSKFKEIPIRLKTSQTCEQITKLIADLEQNAIVSYAHYAMKTENCENAIWEQIGDLCVNSYGSCFFVKVIDENDLTDLEKIVAETKTELIRQDTYMPKWFELRATKSSKGDALKMANYFHETGLFHCAEPGISKYSVE